MAPVIRSARLSRGMAEVWWHGHLARGVLRHGLEARATRMMDNGSGYSLSPAQPWHGRGLVARASCPWCFETRAGSPCHTDDGQWLRLFAQPGSAGGPAAGVVLKHAIARDL